MNDADQVYVVDDDAAIRDSLARLLRSTGVDAACFATIAQFTRAPRPDRCACLLLDVRLPGASGLDLQDQLNRDGMALPVIFMTGYGDIPMTVRAMKGGAVAKSPSKSTVAMRCAKCRRRLSPTWCAWQKRSAAPDTKVLFRRIAWRGMLAG